jgi:hypothetical protein
MSLGDFVKDTITEIVRGVGDAQKHLAEHHPTARVAASVDHDFAPVTDKVEFDIAVTVADSAHGATGIGVKVLGLRMGVDGEIAGRSESVSRVRFTVPVDLPGSTRPKRPPQKARRVASGPQGWLGR